MTHTTFDPEAVLADGDYALPHAVDLSGTLPSIPLTAERGLLPYRPAGGFWSNARETGRYLQTELTHGVAPGGTRGRFGREPGGNLDAESVTADYLRRTAGGGRDHDALRARLAEWAVSRPAHRQPCRG
jgi:CubicO group peptidase (beta-lactamase class C family)